MSSISGSDSSDSDSESDQGFYGDEVTPEGPSRPAEREVSAGRVSSKAVFQNAQGQYLSVQRCVLQRKRVGTDTSLHMTRYMLLLFHKPAYT